MAFNGALTLLCVTLLILGAVDAKKPCRGKKCKKPTTPPPTTEPPTAGPTVTTPTPGGSEEACFRSVEEDCQYAGEVKQFVNYNKEDPNGCFISVCWEVAGVLKTVKKVMPCCCKLSQPKNPLEDIAKEVMKEAFEDMMAGQTGAGMPDLASIMGMLGGLGGSGMPDLSSILGMLGNGSGGMGGFPGMGGGFPGMGGSGGNFPGMGGSGGGFPGMGGSGGGFPGMGGGFPGMGGSGGGFPGMGGGFPGMGGGNETDNGNNEFLMCLVAAMPSRGARMQEPVISPDDQDQVNVGAILDCLLLDPELSAQIQGCMTIDTGDQTFGEYYASLSEAQQNEFAVTLWQCFNPNGAPQ